MRHCLIILLAVWFTTSCKSQVVVFQPTTPTSQQVNWQWTNGNDGIAAFNVATNSGGAMYGTNSTVPFVPGQAAYTSSVPAQSLQLTVYGVDTNGNHGYGSTPIPITAPLPAPSGVVTK